MTSNPSSKLTNIALICVLVLAAAAPAAAVTVGERNVPNEAEAGTQVSASVTLTELFMEPTWKTWTLKGQTELTNVTWTVRYFDATGAETKIKSFDGQTLNGDKGVPVSTEQDVNKIRVELVGTVPKPNKFTYPEKESFPAAKLVQARGSEGSRNPINTWNVHHYTTGTDDEPGSKQARKAISSARGAIADANDAGADVSDANESVQSAKQFYKLGEFQDAVDQANRAEEQANQANSSQKTTQTIMYAILAIVVLALLGGGFWYYQQQQDSYDKLG